MEIKVVNFNSLNLEEKIQLLQKNQNLLLKYHPDSEFVIREYQDKNGRIYKHYIDLIKKYLKLKIPILTGLSATYLYRQEREYQTSPGKTKCDDVRGLPVGHFVVLCGFDEINKLQICALFAPLSGAHVANLLRSTPRS